MHRISLVTIVWAMAATAALGQPKADETGPKPIARAQFITSMDVEFRKIDADKDGRLTVAELEQFQKAKAVADAEARNKALFAQLDTNKSGFLSPAEFAKLVAPPAVVNVQPTLARMDGNRDSSISLTEYRAATLANFDRLDTDRNGTVSPAELRAGGVTPP